jgi:hypothetical protein
MIHSEKEVTMYRLLMSIAALGLGFVQMRADATVLVIDPTVTTWESCIIATGRCGASDDGVALVGGVQQGIIQSTGLEYALPVLPKDAVIFGAYLSIGAYSRYGVAGFQGFQNNAIGTIDLTSYVGNGVSDADDADHRGNVDLTLVQARTTLYDVENLVESYLSGGNQYLGFSVYQTPPGVCGYGSRCEVSLTGDSTEFAFTTPPQLMIAYTQATPLPSPAPEPATWGMFIGGFGLVGGAMRRRRQLRFA